MNISNIKTILPNKNFNFSLRALVDSKMFDEGLWFWGQNLSLSSMLKKKISSK
jgi:hypothetical protein